MVKFRKWDRQKEGVLKRTIDSGTNYQLSWLKHLDPGCPGLGDVPDGLGHPGEK